MSTFELLSTFESLSIFELLSTIGLLSTDRVRESASTGVTELASTWVTREQEPVHP